MMLDNGIRDNKTGLTPSRQIEGALRKIQDLEKRRDQAFLRLHAELNRQGIALVRFDQVSAKAGERMREQFRREILPCLSCYYIRRRQDFPFLNNRDIYAMAVLGGEEDDRQLAVIPCNRPALNRLTAIPEKKDCFILTEELILHFLPEFFPDQRVLSKSLVRITRNADIDADAVFDEDLNYRDHMAEIIQLRNRLAPVRLELSRKMDPQVVKTLRDYLGLWPAQVVEHDTPLDLSFLYTFSDMLRNRLQLFYPSRIPARYQAEEKLLDTVQRRDLLFHYPYESFNAFLRLLHEAAVDDRVRSIHMTLYRVARSSKVAEALAEAAENGKRVEVFVELKARFDEENNIEWSRRLESAGCRVTYGIEHIKVHSKLCLISLARPDGTEMWITQIGTGNYNEKTSKIYTDYSLITADQTIGRDGARVFRALMKGKAVRRSRSLLVAPHCMLPKLTRLIDREIEKGPEGLIRLKINSLTDKDLMKKLIAASRAGVTVEMVVRGICCLKAGLPGYTDHIQIISIVGRYLEHSRLYLFGKGQDMKAYIASADWMTRNMERRVEIAAPIRDSAIRDRLEAIFETLWSDTQQSWSLNAKGKYLRRQPENASPSVNAQESFYLL